jgi:hypothetical protein
MASHVRDLEYSRCELADFVLLQVFNNTGERFKLNKKKHFVGHTIAGYACQVGVSPDLKYVISGDGDGKLWLWDWKSTKVGLCAAHLETRTRHKAPGTKL